MLPPPDDLPDGAPRLAEGRYVLLRRVGAGGMAGVYAAWDTRDRGWRAIKVLLPKHARDRAVRARFEAEARTMVSLRHPNLVRVHDVGSDELPYLVMELVTGGSLHRWVKDHGPMPPRLAVDATLQLCEGLRCVHAAGVVHRDVKPRNVLVSAEGVLKLTDFGIAQVEQSHQTKTGLAMGTLGFMSPEQLHDAKSVDARTDLYATGATLWTQLTGRKARDLFRLDDRGDLLEGVPASLRPILRRCLAYERDERYADVGELSDALRRALPELPPDPPGTPPLAQPFHAPPNESHSDDSFSEILTWDDSADGPFGSDSDAAGGSSASVVHEGAKRSPDRAVRARPSRPAPPPPTGRERLPAGAEFAARRAAAPDELPEYAQGVEQPGLGHRPEVIGLQPKVVAPRRRPWARAVLGVILAVPLIGAVVVVVTLALATADGAWSVGSAEARHRDAEAGLERAVEDAEPLPDDVEVLGMDAGPLRAAWAAWRSAADEESRVEEARGFARLAEATVRPALPLEHRSSQQELVFQRLEPLGAAAEAEVESREAWADAASTPVGRLATVLRLARAPEPGDVAR